MFSMTAACRRYLDAVAVPIRGRSMLRAPIRREAESASAARPNLILVVLDTLGYSN